TDRGYEAERTHREARDGRPRGGRCRDRAGDRDSPSRPAVRAAHGGSDPRSAEGGAGGDPSPHLRGVRSAVARTEHRRDRTGCLPSAHRGSEPGGGRRELGGEGPLRQRTLIRHALPVGAQSPVGSARSERTVASTARAASAPFLTKCRVKYSTCSSCSWKLCGVSTTEKTGTSVSSWTRMRPSITAVATKSCR